MDFRGVPPQKVDESVQLFHLLQNHTARDAAFDGAGFVAAEVDSRGALEQGKDSLQAISAGRKDFLLSRHAILGGLRVAANLGKFVRYVFGGKDEIHRTGINGVPRHAVVFRRLWVLGKGDAAFRLDGFHSLDAVGCGARENHSNRAGLLVLRQRTEKRIDGQMAPTHVAPGHEMEDTAGNFQVRVGGSDIDMVGIHHHA